MELLSEASTFAVKAHDGMRRKRAGLPYILHPMEVAVIASSMTSSQEVIAAAMLHDVVEDAGVSIQELEERFGKRVAELVGSETENKRKNLPAASTWKIRKQESIDFLRSNEDLDVKILYLSDKLSNLRSIYPAWKVEGHDVWQSFNQKDPAEQAWYYRSVAENVSDLSDTRAWKEFDGLVRTIFEGV